MSSDHDPWAPPPPPRSRQRRGGLGSEFVKAYAESGSKPEEAVEAIPKEEAVKAA